MVVTRSGANPSVTNGTGQKTSQDGSSANPANKNESRLLHVLFVSLVLDLLAFTVILPLLPSLLDYYGSKEDSLYTSLKQSVTGFREFVGAPDTPRWNSVLFGGLIGSLFSLLQFIASPVIGAASDVYGRKPLLIMSMVGVTFSYAIWAMSHNFALFVLARIIGGIFKGNISLSTAIVADILPVERRGKGMALIGIAFSIGFVFGPLIGAGFSRWARDQEGTFFVVPALFALTFAAVDVVFVVTFLPETLPQGKRAKAISWQKSVALINPVSLFKFSSVENMSAKDLADVRKVGLVYFIYLFLYSGLEFTLTFLTHNRLQYDSMQQGKMFFFLGTVMTIIQGGYVRRIPAGREQKTAAQGMLILIPSFIIMAFAYSATVLYIGLLLFGFASATVVPSMTTWISLYGRSDQKGTLLGIFRSLGSLARALGPVFTSTMYWSLGAEVTYVCGAVLLIVPFLMLKYPTAATKPVSSATSPKKMN